MSHVYCPECGFQNPETANYCSRCGTLLVKDEPGGETTMTYSPEDIGDETGVGLDDVTVSRRHAVLVERDGGFFIEDQGSLNGTFVNRRRIDVPTRLENGDELQIGKYRLSFITR